VGYIIVIVVKSAKELLGGYANLAHNSLAIVSTVINLSLVNTVTQSTVRLIVGGLRG